MATSIGLLSRFSEAVRRNLEENLMLKNALASINQTRCTNYVMHKPKQSDCIRSLRESDVIACLKTGYGKSLIFESLPYMTDVKKSTVLVINPLNSIIAEQMNRYGDNAVCVSPELIEGLKKNTCEKDCDCKYCKFVHSSFRYVIGHPEHFLQKTLFDIFKNTWWQENVTHIVIDEAHCIEKWGTDFRTDYSRISKLRSAFPHARVLALTGTATKKTCETIKKNIALRKVHVVKTSVVRNNIKLIVQPRPPQNSLESYEKIIGPLIAEFHEKREMFPKTVVYSKLKWVATGYQMTMLPKHDGTAVSDSKERVSQYHASCTDQLKKQVVDDMCGDSIRLLFATEAYSMGTDAPDIKRIVHFGVPNSLETYLQEVGRAGRNGQPSEATLYYNKYDVGKNMPIDSAVRDFVLSSECRWNYICSYFSSDFEKKLTGHDCCDNCEKRCNCELCKNPIDDHDDSELCENRGKKRKLMKDSKSILVSMLSQYFSAENEIAELPVNVPITGLTDDLIKIIVDSYIDFKSPDLILEKFPFLNLSYAHNIAMIVEQFENSLQL